MNNQIYKLDCKWCKQPVFIMKSGKNFKKFDKIEDAESDKFHVCKGFKEVEMKDIAELLEGF